MPPTPLRRAAIVALALVAIACGAPTKPKATFTNILSSYSLYGYTGAPVTAPTAVSFLGGPTRADASFAFDVAFDVNASGQAIVYPVRTLASDLAIAQVLPTPKRVGLQTVSGSFESVREVPSSGYDTLTAKTVSSGQVLAVEIVDTRSCLFSLGGSSIYAKLVVDSVPPAASGGRRIYARAVVDANCGYHQVMPDTIPER